ncbi:hypothetical protein [Nocardia vinacea]|uniref:hypothetical protein n=1 Tax=Nocardia vinacea TaxID=96468 RepID=UPI0002F57745|nr:hypothetical protein [Nocardia vinacea]
MAILGFPRSRARFIVLPFLGDSMRELRAQYTLTEQERANLRASCTRAAVHTAALGAHTYLA